MKWRPPVLLFVGLCWASWSFLYRPFILLGENGVLDLVAPPLISMTGWYYLSPAVLILMVGLILLVTRPLRWGIQESLLGLLGALPTKPL